MELILEGKQGKTVHVAGDAIRIVKKGLFSGRNERTLLIRNISSVEVKKPRDSRGSFSSRSQAERRAIVPSL